MTRKNAIIPFDPDDGLDYRLENLFKRACNQPVEKTPLRFGEQFKENERFMARMVAEMTAYHEERELADAINQERKEERQWLREGHETLKQTRKYLRDRKAPSSAGRASTPGKSSPR